MMRSSTLERMHRDITAGIDKCQRSCEYFALCKGSQPAAKFFENETFDCSSTRLCELARKTVIEAGLSTLEKTLLP